MKILFVILISGNSCFAMWGQAKELAEKAAHHGLGIFFEVAGWCVG